MVLWYSITVPFSIYLIYNTFNMAKNPISRTITVLERNNVTLGIYTNNLAAYNALEAQLPVGTKEKLMSYSTVNRAVRKSGDSLDIPTIVGIFVIRKCPLYRFHT